MAARLHIQRCMDNRLLNDLAALHPTEPRENPRRVLVSIADHGLRRLIASVIRVAGHRVTESADDSTLLEKLSSARAPESLTGAFQVLIRDARRDPRAALGALACLRRVDRTIPVVLIVPADPDDIFERNAHRLGAVLLRTPVDSRRIRTAVAALGIPAAYRKRLMAA